MKKPLKKTVVKVDRQLGTENSTTVKVLATAISDIAKGMRAIMASPLKRDAIVVLINHKTKVTMVDINAVLDSLENLEATWLKKK